MKAISLWQPWASLMAAGYKRIETRSWSPRELHAGDLVAIHAARHWTAEECDICEDDPFFKRFLTLAQRRGLWDFTTPPLGAVIAIARFQSAIPTEQIKCAAWRTDYSPARQAQMRLWVSEHERAFGNYQPNRYGWLFSEVRPISPMPLRGQRGIFDWTPPLAPPYLEPVSRASDERVGA